jgi:ABC-type nitrate/sulfonate/bicarbonate transport system substrate-binding protein
MREAGWKIEEVQYSNIPAAVQGVALKEADCGWLSDSARLAAMDKEPGLKLKGLFEGAGDPWVIVARNNIADFTQLNDRPLAQGVPGQINDFLLDKSVDKYGVHPQIIRFNDSEQRAQALIAGQVDSGLVSIDDVVTLERARPGQFRVLIRYKDELPDIAGNYFACSGAFIDQYPDAVQAMVDQQMLAYRRAYDDPSWYLTQVKTKITEADDASLKARYDAFIQNRIWNPNGNMGPRTLEATFNAYKEGQIFKGDITVADWSDPRFIENTLRKLGEYQFKS